jgi:hypothetical protein
MYFKSHKSYTYMICFLHIRKIFICLKQKFIFVRSFKSCNILCLDLFWKFLRETSCQGVDRDIIVKITFTISADHKPFAQILIL